MVKYLKAKKKKIDMQCLRVLAPCICACTFYLFAALLSVFVYDVTLHDEVYKQCAALEHHV